MYTNAYIFFQTINKWCSIQLAIINNILKINYLNIVLTYKLQKVRGGGKISLLSKSD
jgi:hypothetical protein